MSFKRAMLIITTLLLAGAVMFVLVECSSEVAADLVGPPTIETHLTNINAAIVLNTRIVLGVFGIIGALIVYIFKSTIGNLKSSIRHVEANVGENTKDIKDIRKNFMSIETHDRIQS